MKWIAFALLFLQSSNPDLLWQHRNRGKAFYENPTTQLQAVEEFEKALKLAPESARDRLNYALALLRAGKNEQAIAELKRVQQQDPEIPHTWFNLGIASKRAGETEQAIAQFEKLLTLSPDDAVTNYNLGVLYKLQGDSERSIAQFEKTARLAPSLAAPHFQLFNAYRLSGKREAAQRELGRFQELKKAAEAAGITEDMEWNDFAEVYDPIEPSPGDVGAPVPVRFARKAMAVSFDASGDFDNDGVADRCVLLAGKAEIRRKGVAVLSVAGDFVKALWIDYDHDYDLDLLLLGSRSVLLRNEGAGGFAERTSDFPFVAGKPIDAVTYRVTPDSKGNDVVVSYADRNAVLYRDRLAGTYTTEELPAVPSGATRLTVADWDHDSYLDLVFATTGKVHLLSRFQPARIVDAKGFAVGDFDNDGRAELVTEREAPELAAAPRVQTGDFTNDGRLDIGLSNGHVLANATPSKFRSITVRLSGIKNRKLAEGAEVEVRAGRLFQKKIYNGTPLLFGVRGHTQIDAVRITWPNGLIQHEARQPVGKPLEYKEAQRLSGSCPMIFTWNGSRFEFLTDALGVAPLGASAGDGEFFATDHDEYIWVPGAALQERNGMYEMRVTEELGEVTYLDHLKLIAVDHPSEVSVFSNDKWKAPPYPDFRLFQTTQRWYSGDEALRSSDRRYRGPAKRTMLNTAETHALELDFGPEAPNRGAFLVLRGWVDWADGSTFRKQSQEPGQVMVSPYLQVRNAQGEWQTVIQDMGVPSGKTKTIAVDLSGRFLSESREIRIVTNLCVYWDEVFLGLDTGDRSKRSGVPLAKAELAFHGFSRPVIHPERLQPEHFVYEMATSTPMWNPTPGLYTRFGDVRSLLASVDDHFVIMGSGDEIRLQFRALAPPPPGWTRDFLLYFDGWAKDNDANTAYSQSVDPLPFHGMKQYPYGSAEGYPDDEAHRRYRREWNTRPALRLLRPLATR